MKDTSRNAIFIFLLCLVALPMLSGCAKETIKDDLIGQPVVVIKDPIQVDPNAPVIKLPKEGARGVILVYPGNEIRFFSPDGVQIPVCDINMDDDASPTEYLTRKEYSRGETQPKVETCTRVFTAKQMLSAAAGATCPATQCLGNDDNYHACYVNAMGKAKFRRRLSDGADVCTGGKVFPCAAGHQCPE